MSVDEEKKMQLRISGIIHNKDLYWHRKGNDIVGSYQYDLFRGEYCVNFSLSIDQKKQIKEVTLPQYLPQKVLDFSPENTDEKILKQLTNTFLMFDRLSPAFPAEQRFLEDTGDYAIGTCKGFYEKVFIQIYGLRKVYRKDRSSEDHDKSNLREWKVFVCWGPMTNLATGYSIGLRQNQTGDVYKRESLSITDPEDIAFWALTVIRDQGTL